MKKTKKISNLKKFLLSSFAVFSVAATGGGIISALNTNNQLTNIKQQRNDASTASVTPPEANDLYNDYSYTNGFVTINNAVISFTDWFGFNVWSYDVNANLTTLFGSSSATVESLKVRSSTDGTQIYAYGYLSDDSSFLFVLNTTDGSVVSIGNYKAIHDSSLVTDANLLTIINGVAILTPKTPEDDIGANETVIIHFNEINLTTGYITTNAYDISKSAYVNNAGAGLNLNVVSGGYGEIIGVQKEDSNYSFEIKAIVYDDTTYAGRTNTSKARVDVLLINVSNGTYTKGTKEGFWNYTTYSSDAVDLDLDRAAFTLLTTNSNNTLTTYVTAKFDTTTTTIGSANASGSSAYNATNLIAYSALTSTTYGVQTLSYSDDQSSSDAIAGTIGFLYDQTANTPYAIVADTNSTSKISIFSLTSDSINPTWIDLSSIVNTNKNQILNVNFIPSNTTSSQSTTTYTGYVEVQQQTDTSSTQLTESKAFFTLSANGTASAPTNNVFTFAMSDSQIQSKYQNGVYQANSDTENQLLNDLIQVNQNGQPYNGVTYTNNLVISGNTITGNVVLSLNNWWNSSKSQVTRNVNLTLASSSSTTNPGTDQGGSSGGTTSGGTTSGGTSNTNPNNPTSNTVNSSSTNSGDQTALYIVIPIVIVILIALALGIFFYVQHKKKSQFKTLKNVNKK